MSLPRSIRNCLFFRLDAKGGEVWIAMRFFNDKKNNLESFLNC